MPEHLWSSGPCFGFLLGYFHATSWIPGLGYSFSLFAKFYDSGLKFLLLPYSFLVLFSLWVYVPFSHFSFPFLVKCEEKEEKEEINDWLQSRKFYNEISKFYFFLLLSENYSILHKTIFIMMPNNQHFQTWRIWPYTLTKTVCFPLNLIFKPV